MSLDNAHLRIRIYSHHFSCQVFTPRGRSMCYTFAKSYTQFGYGRGVGASTRIALKVYATATLDRNEFRFHINTLSSFKTLLEENQIVGNQVIFITEQLPIEDVIDLPVKTSWTTRAHQIKPIEYCVAQQPKNKLVELQTGAGKGYVAIKSISLLKKRAVIIVRPMYIDKLTKEFINTCDIDPDDIISVQGSSQLMSLLLLAKENKITEKIIIISNKTIQGWYKNYEKYKLESLDLGYSCYPYELFSILKAGIRLVDEVHMDIHLQAKIDMYTHVGHSISLSATLLSDDPFVSRMQEIMYPLIQRYEAGPLDKYIDAFAITYRLNNVELIRTTEWGSTTYSHVAFEKSIIRNKQLLNNYIKVIDYIISISYEKTKREKKKLLVFSATIDLCTELTRFFTNKYKDLDIRRYCEDDPYENLLEPDIRFSTILSAGTGHDIPDLTTCIMTTNISSTQSNIQALGRLRRLWDNHQVEFYYLYCSDIPKQVEYHVKKTELMQKRAKSIRMFDSGIVV